jgi:hypothetical protein
MSLLSNSPIENRCYIVNRLANACELYGTKFCLPSSSSLRELSPLLLVDYCVSWQKKEIVNILPSCTAGSGCVNTANLISTYLAAPPPPKFFRSDWFTTYFTCTYLYPMSNYFWSGFQILYKNEMSKSGKGGSTCAIWFTLLNVC